MEFARPLFYQEVSDVSSFERFQNGRYFSRISIPLRSPLYPTIRQVVHIDPEGGDSLGLLHSCVKRGGGGVVGAGENVDGHRHKVMI